MKNPKRDIEIIARQRVLEAGLYELSDQSDVFEAARQQLEMRGVQVPPKGTDLSVADLIALLHRNNGAIKAGRLVHITRRFQEHLAARRFHCAFRSLLREMRGAVIAAPIVEQGAAHHAH
jgi:hypothetical protein